MPRMTVADLIAKLREMPLKCFVGIQGADGHLTTDVLGPKMEIFWVSLTGDNTNDEDEAAFLDEFQIADVEMQVAALRPGQRRDDRATANEP